MKRTKRKYISSFMAMILFAGTITISAVPTETALAATDTYGHWAESTINKWTASGYITGYPDGTFRPNNAISRAEFVTLANKAFGYNVPASINFTDVNSSYWAYNEIQKGVSAGYIRGDAAGTFRPGAAVTRQEAAVMMSQIKKLQQDSNRAMNYTDYDSISNWAKPYVGAVSSVKIMQGFPNGAFRPQTSMTRAEAVTALENAIFAAPQVPSSNTTINPNPDTSVNNSPGSSFNNNNTNSNTSSSSRPTDSEYTLEENTLRNRIISGDLIISDSLEGKTVTLMNVTVNGTVKVQGGSTIRVQSCDFNNVELDKSNVIFNSDSKSKIKSLTFLEKGKIEGTGYENVYVEDDSLSEATIDATVNYLELDTDANLKLYKNADVSTLEITSDAEDGEVTFTSGAKVEDMNIRGKIRISGRGDIEDMTTYVSGVRSSIRPDNLTTRGDGEKPSYTSGERGHSSSSSSGSDYDDLTIDREDRRYDADGERYHNVTIEADGVEFRDATVYNRLTITRDVEDGEVLIEDVKVRGDVYIYGGGKNSVIFRDCDIQGDIISDKDIDSRYGEEPVALEFEDGTEVGDIRVRGETIIRAENGIKINTVTVDRTLDEELELDAAISTLNLYNDCDVRILGRSRINKVEVSANRDVTFRMESGSQIDTLDSKSDVVLRGTGTVKTIKTDKTISKDSGIVNDDQASTFVAVTNILGIPTTGITGTALTLNPVISPANASYQTVKWTTDSGSIADDKVLTVQKDGTVHLTATIENGKEIGTAFTKDFTITFSSGSGGSDTTPPTPTEKGSVTRIEAADSVVQGDSLELTAKGSNLSGKTIKWSISGNSAGTSLSSTIGEKVTLTVADTQSTADKITVKAWVDGDQTQAKAASKEITVTANSTPPATPTVKSITATKTNVKKEDTFTLSATIDGTLGENDTITWSSSPSGYINIEKDSTDKLKATATVLEADTSASKIITITAKIGNEAGKTVTITIAKDDSNNPPATNNVAVTGIKIKGIGNSENTEECAMKGGKFKATATLNRELQDGESIDWTFEESSANTLATIVKDEINQKEATITITVAEQPAQETRLTVKAQVKKDGTIIADSTKTAKMYIAGIEKTIGIAINGQTPSIIHSDEKIELTDSFQVSARVIPENSAETAKIVLESSNNNIFTVTKVNETDATFTLTPKAIGTATLTAKLDNLTVTRNVEVKAVPASQSEEPQTEEPATPAQNNEQEPVTTMTARKSVRRAPAVPTVQEQPEEKPYVIDITLPTQEGEVGKDFDLSQANMEATGDFEIDWIVGRGFAETPDDHTVRMDRVGSVIMTAVVVGGQPNGDVYTKDFEITFTEPKVETPVVPEQPKEETPVASEQPKEETPVVPEQPKEETPVAPEQPKEETPVAPEQPKEETPVAPEQPKEETPVVPEQPKEETPVAPEQPKEETPVVPEQPKEETPVAPEQPKEETPVAPEQPKEETPVAPEQPKEETPVAPEQPKEETLVAPEQPKEETLVAPEQPKEETLVAPEQPVQPEDENIVISTKGNLVVNGKITLSAKNKLGVEYPNAVWSIIDDGGTGAVLTSPEVTQPSTQPSEITASQEVIMVDISAPEAGIQEDTAENEKEVPAKNVLIAKKPGTITIKVTLGNDTTKIRTKKIIIK